MVHYSEGCFLAKCLLLLALLVHLVLLAWAMNAGLLKIALDFTWVVLVMKLQCGRRLREIPFKSDLGSKISHSMWLHDMDEALLLLLVVSREFLVRDFDLTQMLVSSLLVQGLQEW
jgi:hypothetical protein